MSRYQFSMLMAALWLIASNVETNKWSAVFCTAMFAWFSIAGALDLFRSKHRPNPAGE